MALVENIQLDGVIWISTMFNRSMKKIFLFLAVVFIVGSGFAFAFTEVITYLKGRAETDAVVLEWQSGTEDGVKNFSVERSDIKGSEFSEIAILPATGSNSYYKYRDAAINMAPMNGGTNHSPNMPLSDLYKYRLKINYAKEISYSQTISVTRPSSGVKRTWGMIKEMFR